MRVQQKSNGIVGLGTEIGLPEEEIRGALKSEEFSQKVESDIREAEALGIRSVPFFVFDRKYAVSGAQPPAHFKQVLEASLKERIKENI